MQFLFLTALVILSRVVNAQVEEVVAVLPQGKLVGAKLFTTESFRPYLAFSNIPYAKPPLGNLRFKPPQDPPTWRGTRVLKFPPICYQWVRTFETSNFFGQEDCLYINVFTPVIPLNEKTKLPVIVCIHGGDFQRGSSYECPANNFMEKNVVFVSFNYRLGIFGFMSAGDKILPGNYGLKDQVAALKWVRKNIKSFGGDPDRVTIMGSGAGGSSVHYHLYSPLSKGLFHSAISQSGSALIPWAFTPPDVARNRTITMANLMNCPNDTTGEIYMCLSKVQSKVLVEMQPKLATWFSEPNVVFTPTMEPANVEKAFLSKNPLKESEENTVPWIIGFNSGEGVLKSTAYFGNNGFLLDKLNNESDKALPTILTYDVTAKSEDIPAITKAIKKFYLNNKPVTSESATGLINLFTDSMVAHGCMKAAARYTGTRYFYLYDHINQKSFSEFLTFNKGYEKYKMASHSDELMSLFYVPWSYAKKDSIENDVSVSRRMLGFWMNFIENNDPNGKSNETVWKPMQSNKFEYLRITTKADLMESNLLTEKYQFWENLPITSRMDTIEVTFTSATSRDEL